MTTHFITAEIDLQDSPGELLEAIQSTLQKQGEPLRWAITTVDTTAEKAHVEAVVIEQEQTVSPV
jgi:ACT domain-containing protein